jgi:hypothetical protein
MNRKRPEINQSTELLSEVANSLSVAALTCSVSVGPSLSGPITQEALRSKVAPLAGAPFSTLETGKREMTADDYVGVILGIFTFFLWTLIGLMQWLG